MISNKQNERLDRLRKERNLLKRERIKRERTKRNLYNERKKSLYIIFILCIAFIVVIPFIISCFLSYHVCICRERCKRILCSCCSRIKGLYAVLRKDSSRKINSRSRKVNSPPTHYGSHPQESRNNGYAQGGIIPKQTDHIPVLLSPGQTDLPRDIVEKYGQRMLDAINRNPPCLNYNIPQYRNPLYAIPKQDEYNKEPFCYDLDGLKEQTDAPKFAYAMNTDYVEPDQTNRDIILQKIQESDKRKRPTTFKVDQFQWDLRKLHDSDKKILVSRVWISC